MRTLGQVAVMAGSGTHTCEMERMREWFGTPRKAGSTLIWLCFVLLMVSVLVVVAQFLIFWVTD